MQRSALALAVGLAVCATVAGCGGPRVETIDGSCTDGVTAVWSSLEGKTTVLETVADGKMVARSIVQSQGVSPSETGQVRKDGHTFFLSQGNEDHDRTDLVDWNPTTCSASVTQLKDVFQPLAFVGDGRSFYTTNTLDAQGEFRRFDASGKLLARQSTPGIAGEGLALGDDALYAFTREFKSDGDVLRLLVMDPETLEIRERQPMPYPDSLPSSAVIHDGDLIYPMTTLENGGDGHELVVMDLTTYKARKIDLKSTLPYLLRLKGDTLYVGHTFFNPDSGPISENRRVSTVDLTTDRVSGADLDAGIKDMQVGDDTLYLLGDTGDEATSVLQTYSTASMEQTSSLTLKRPTGRDYYYSAPLIIP